MGRPKNGTSNELERLLTRTICQEVYLRSELTMAQLEEFFEIGVKDPWGKYTSKTFSRYCESDPKKESRSAPRDTLKRIVEGSVKKGWLSSEQIRGWYLHDLLALDHEYAYAVFEKRKKERDALVKSLRELRAAGRKTAALLSTLSSIGVAMSMSAKKDSISLKRQELVDLLSDVAPGLLECVAPNSVSRTLDLLEGVLEQAVVVFRRGQEDVPVIHAHTLHRLRKVEKVSVTTPSNLDAQMADIENLLKMVEDSMT
jgi:hypothetical protein